MSNNREATQVSILGCGWLGLPLAGKLIAEGFLVKGSSSTTEKLSRLDDVGITAFQLQLHEDTIKGDISGFLDDSHILIVDIPPGLRGDPASSFIRKMRRLISAVEESKIKHMLFVSSTSVFEDGVDFPHYTEADRSNGSSETARQLAAVETMLMSNVKVTTTVLRFGGLCGPGRDPRRFLGRRNPISNPEAPVNLIHQDDCIGLILRIIAKRAWTGVFHGVYPDHPQRKTFARFPMIDAESDKGLSGSGETSVGKIISSTFTCEELKFQFRHKP